MINDPLVIIYATMVHATLIYQKSHIIMVFLIIQDYENAFQVTQFPVGFENPSCISKSQKNSPLTSHVSQKRQPKEALRAGHLSA